MGRRFQPVFDRKPSFSQHTKKALLALELLLRKSPGIGVPTRSGRPLRVAPALLVCEQLREERGVVKE